MYSPTAYHLVSFRMASSPATYLLRRFGQTKDLGLLQLGVSRRSPLATFGKLFDSFNPNGGDFVVEPFGNGSDESAASHELPLHVDAYVERIDEYYKSAAAVKGMGENDLGVTFAGTVGDPLFDASSREIIAGTIDGIKQQSARHGVPFFCRTSGLTLDVSDVKNGLLPSLGLKVR